MHHSGIMVVHQRIEYRRSVVRPVGVQSIITMRRVAELFFRIAASTIAYNGGKITTVNGVTLHSSERVQSCRSFLPTPSIDALLNIARHKRRARTNERPVAMDWTHDVDGVSWRHDRHLQLVPASGWRMRRGDHRACGVYGARGRAARRCFDCARLLVAVVSDE